MTMEPHLPPELRMHIRDEVERAWATRLTLIALLLALATAGVMAFLYERVIREAKAKIVADADAALHPLSELYNNQENQTQILLDKLIHSSEELAALKKSLSDLETQNISRLQEGNQTAAALTDTLYKYKGFLTRAYSLLDHFEKASNADLAEAASTLNKLKSEIAAQDSANYPQYKLVPHESGSFANSCDKETVYLMISDLTTLAETIDGHNIVFFDKYSIPPHVEATGFSIDSNGIVSPLVIVARSVTTSGAKLILLSNAKAFSSVVVFWSAHE